MHTDRHDEIRIISARKATRNMKVMKNDPDKYDFNGGVCEKYDSKYKEETNIIMLDPELIKYFPDSASVKFLK